MPLYFSLARIRTGNEARLRPAQCVSWGERAPVALCREPTEAVAETKSFCPCQKSQVSLLRYLTFSLVCGRIWQRGAPAGPPAVRVVGRASASGALPRRSRLPPRSVLGAPHWGAAPQPAAETGAAERHRWPALLGTRFWSGCEEARRGAGEEQG